MLPMMLHQELANLGEKSWGHFHTQERHSLVLEMGMADTEAIFATNGRAQSPKADNDLKKACILWIESRRIGSREFTNVPRSIEVRYSGI